MHTCIKYFTNVENLLFPLVSAVKCKKSVLSVCVSVRECSLSQLKCLTYGPKPRISLMVKVKVKNVILKVSDSILSDMCHDVTTSHDTMTSQCHVTSHCIVHVIHVRKAYGENTDKEGTALEGVLTF